MHGAEGHCVNEVRSIALWAGVVPLVVLTSVILGLLLTPWAFLGAAVLLGYPALWWKIRAHRLRLGDDATKSDVFARHVVLGKFAELSGMVRYHWNRLRGTRSGLVEYKGTN